MDCRYLLYSGGFWSLENLNKHLIQNIKDMKLLSLEIENWACHEKLRIDLSQGLQIEGRNGAGKSSILEAIRFIFSESSRGYKSKIKSGTNSSRVKLRFSKDSDIYSIEKKLHTKKPSTATMWINRERVADNPSSVYKRLQEVLTENVLDKLIYVPQGSLTALINRLRIKGGRQELDALLGLDKLERVYRGIGGELRVKEAQLEMILKQIAKYPENAEKEYNEEIERLENEKRILEKKFDKYKKNQNVLDSKIKQLGGKIDEMRNIKKKKEELERKINEFKLKSTGLRKGLESLKVNMKLIQERKKEMDRLINTERNLRRYVPIRDLLTRLENDEQKLKELEDLENKEKILKEIEKSLKDRDEIQAKYDRYRLRMMKLEREIAINNQQINEQKNYLRDLGSLDRKAKCPRCGQILTKEHLQKEKRISEDKIKDLEKELNDLNLELEKVEGREESLKRELEDLNRKEVEKKQLKEEIEKGIKERESLLSDIQNIKKDLGGLGYSNETLALVEDRITELGNIQGRINVFKEEIKKEKDYAQEIHRNEDQLYQVTKREEEFREEFNKLRYDDALFEELQKKRENFLEQHREVSIEMERCEFQIKENKNRGDELNSKKNEFLELKRREREINKEINLMKEASEIFHTNKGIVRYLRERCIYQLSILITRYFRRINQNPKYREIIFDKNYEIEIKSSEGNFSIDQLSGGEKVQLAIALRIALLEILSPIRLLILDEPFGSLDRDHRDVLGEALNKVASDGQLILVTHIPVDSLQLPERLELGGY